MKIAFDYQIFSLQHYGGISRYFVKLMENFLILQQNIKAFAPIHLNCYLKDLPHEVVWGYKWSKYPRYTHRLINYVNDVVASIKMQQWAPDVVHETYYFRRFYNKPRCPVVLTVYDMIHERFAEFFSANDPTFLKKKAAVARADHVICISESTKKDLMDILGTPEEKISVIHLGFDVFPVSENELIVNTDKPYLLYVGQRGGYKNFKALLEAVAQSPRLTHDFDIIAFGGGAFSAEERALITTLGFKEKQVRQVSGDDTVLGGLYQKATAFVYPSLYEGFGIPPLEAMAHHCPVISSNTSSMPEVIGDAGVFFNPLMHDNIREAIEQVVYDKLYAAQLVDRGLKQLDKFSWMGCAQETLAVYNSL